MKHRRVTRYILHRADQYLQRLLAVRAGVDFRAGAVNRISTTELVVALTDEVVATYLVAIYAYYL